MMCAVIVSSTRPSFAQGRTAALRAHTEFLCELYGLKKELVAGVIVTESSGRISAVGRGGEIGLMQLNVHTARRVAGNPSLTRAELQDPFTNLAIGIRHLHQLKKRFRSMRLALLAFNRGEAKVSRDLRSGTPMRNTYVEKVCRRSGSLKRLRFR